MSTVHTTSVRFIRSGQNAISVMLSQDNIVHKKNTDTSIYSIEISLIDKNVVSPSEYSISIYSFPVGINPQILENGTEGYKLMVGILPTATWDTTIPITLIITYGSYTIRRLVYVSLIENGNNGEKGERGASLRGPQDWKEVGSGYQFYSGADGEPYLDFVVYKNNYYLCKKSHTKSIFNYPTSSFDNNSGLWQLSDKIDMVATKVLLSQYICVENLGAEAIEMKDDDGNLVFLAKGGNVTCKTGTFENVNVSGIIKANLMYSSVRMLSEQNPGSSTYNIDPVNAPANTYFANIAFTHTKFVYLPDAVAYEGLELNFYQIALTNNGLGTLYIAAVNSQKIYYNTVAKLIDDNIIPVKLPIVASDTRVKPSPNEIIRIKAMAGAWYVMTGLVTEE